MTSLHDYLKENGYSISIEGPINSFQFQELKRRLKNVDLHRYPMAARAIIYSVMKRGKYRVEPPRAWPRDAAGVSGRNCDTSGGGVEPKPRFQNNSGCRVSPTTDAGPKPRLLKRGHD